MRKSGRHSDSPSQLAYNEYLRAAKIANVFGVRVDISAIAKAHGISRQALHNVVARSFRKGIIGGVVLMSSLSAAQASIAPAMLEEANICRITNLMLNGYCDISKKR